VLRRAEFAPTGELIDSKKPDCYSSAQAKDVFNQNRQRAPNEKIVATFSTLSVFFS
jgi:hypothetical protein